MVILVLMFAVLLGAAPIWIMGQHQKHDQQVSQANILAQILAAEHLAAMETCKLRKKTKGCTSATAGQKIDTTQDLSSEIVSSALYQSGMFVSVFNRTYIISFIDQMNSKGGVSFGEVVQQLINNTGQVAGVGYYDLQDQKVVGGASDPVAGPITLPPEQGDYKLVQGTPIIAEKP